MKAGITAHMGGGDLQAGDPKGRRPPGQYSSLFSNFSTSPFNPVS